MQKRTRQTRLITPGALKHLEKALENAKSGIEEAKRAQLAIDRFWVIAKEMGKGEPVTESGKKFLSDV